MVVVRTGTDGILQTIPAGDDVVPAYIATNGGVIATSAANTGPCVSYGTDGSSQTTLSGDDVVVGTVIYAGPNGRCDSTANSANSFGDDIQVVAVGSYSGVCGREQTVDVTELGDDVDTDGGGSDGFILSGDNGFCDTGVYPSGSTLVNPMNYSTPNSAGILPGPNGVLDTTIPNPISDDVVAMNIIVEPPFITSISLPASVSINNVVRTGNDGILQTSPLGDDVVPAYIATNGGVIATSAANTGPCVYFGTNGSSDSILSGDDVVVGTTIYAGSNGRCDSIANSANSFGDDIQVVAVGSYSGVCGREQGVADVIELGDDWDTDGPGTTGFILTGDNGVCDTSVVSYPSGTTMIVPMNYSTPDSAGIVPGPNGILDTTTPNPISDDVSVISTGAGTFDLTINGSNFDNGAVDQVYSPTWAFIGQGAIKSRTSTQIVVVEYMNGAAPGNYTVYVKNSDNKWSNGVTLTITNPPIVPTDKFLTYISPDPYGDPSRVYWIQNNKRYHVIDGTLIDTMRNNSIPGWSWRGVYTISNSYTQGTDFISTASASNGMYIRLYGGTDVYKINNGQKEYVSNAVCQQVNCWFDVIDVPQTYLDMFPTSQVGPLAHSIIGSVTENGTGLGSVTMTLSGAASATTTTAGDGTYSFPNLADENYTVTPSMSNYNFTPPSRLVTVAGADVTAQDFSAACIQHTYYRDADGDTYGNASYTIQLCAQPFGYVTNSADCNDSNASINPGVGEICNGVDDNCNAQIDEGGICGVPDLVVTTVTAPATGLPGSTTTVGDTTKNNGPGIVPASTTRFYWSANSTLDALDTYLGSRAVPALAISATNTGTTTGTVPATACSGTFYIIAKADADNLIAETIETNNTKSKTIKTGPDLIISIITAPATGGAGQITNVTDTTKNNGGCPAAATTTKLYLSINSTWDAGDTYLGERAVPALAAGATDTGITPVLIPAGTATGSYYIIAKADANAVVPETSETNNTKSKLIKIGPDLIISAIAAPASALHGSTISITDTTKNSGGGAAGASTTKLYLSTNTTYDAGDTYLGERVVPTLAAGAVNALATSVTIPAGIAAGTYYIIGVADGNSVVVEVNETNNTKSRSITINP